ncbi:MAG: hypothetical protein GX682_06435 [Clostridiaceae bacterium]|nr:hypothetical protein [Clostridiaceae bacterium]
MIYPEKISAKKGSKIIKLMLLASVLVGIILIVMNRFLKPHIPWAMLSTAGIIYSWITVLYAINKNTNIAKHVLIQTVAISILSIFIDYMIGFKGWSISMAIPITIITANVTMFVLTIVTHKKYIKYAIYQLILIIISLLPIFFIFEHMLQSIILTIIAISISVINFIVSLSLCMRDFKEIMVRKFHM